MILILPQTNSTVRWQKSCTNMGCIKSCKILQIMEITSPSTGAGCLPSTVAPETMASQKQRIVVRPRSFECLCLFAGGKYSTIEHIRGSPLLNHLWIVHPDPKSTLLTRKNAGKKKTVQSLSNTSCVSKFVIIYNYYHPASPESNNEKNKVVVTSLNRPPSKNR